MYSKLKREPEHDYSRQLAELTPDERLRLLEMDFNLQRTLQRKLVHRRKLAELSPSEKLRLLEELRNRAEIQRGSRRSKSPESPVENSQTEEPNKTPSGRSSRNETAPHRFGGRATAGGVNYEVRVAALIAVKMLVGSGCSVSDGIGGEEVSAIAMQADEPVDDIVVSLHGDPDASIFISAKERSGTISLTAKSPAFAETVEAFVRQFLKTPAASRTKGRLLWAVPSCVGRAVTHGLPNALNTHRLDAGDTSLADFLHGRRASEKKALDGFLLVAKKAWNEISGNFPTDEELRCFLRQAYVQAYDFGVGHPLELQAENDIRSHIVADPAQARRLWQKLEGFFADVNQRGVRITSASLRNALVADGFMLKSPPDYTQDISRLRELTSRNLADLRGHAVLNFGPSSDDAIHIERPDDLSPLLTAAKSGHFLITGKPGCGKSGLISKLVDGLQNAGVPVVLLLAEEIFGRDWKGSANLPGLVHDLDEVLANWPDGARGVLVTDALDAVRDTETQQMLRRLLRDVKTGQSGWTVIASVRKFDLQFGRELREMFPGDGVGGHVSNEFAGVAHFHLGRLSESQVDDLVSRREQIRPFIAGARQSIKSEGIHLSPFYLRLAAELLRDGVTPSRLADWSSPAVLLRKFWEYRVKEGAGASHREVVLKAICRRMVDVRSMAVSLKELSLGASELPSVDELRSRGILQAPSQLHGTCVGGDEIRFTHHLLHDYAIARSLIPEPQTLFCDFTIRETLLPIFYRQSFLFALEELWDGDGSREAYWQSALRLESVTSLHGLTRILAPILAARRVENLADLKPLLAALASDGHADSSGQKALRHLASGLHDAQDDAIRGGAAGWCAFAEELGKLLSVSPSIEGPLAHIVARLNAIGGGTEAEQRLVLNAAARSLLAHHLTKPVGKGWRYPALVAIESVCRTFRDAPVESEGALLALLAPERLEQFPHHDLQDLADNVRQLGASGEGIVLRLFEAAFGDEPEYGKWETQGGAIMSMRLQTSDSWKIIGHSLAGLYEGWSSDSASQITEVACIVWNAVVRRHAEGWDRPNQVLATIQFRGATCDLIQDYSHIWGAGFEYDEIRILSHFKAALRGWAAASDTEKLNVALDRFAARNRTSLLWSTFFEIGAEYPATLGMLLEDLLKEPTFLIHADYIYGAAALMGALHKAGNREKRERLESLIIDLPKYAQPDGTDRWYLTLSSIEYAQNRLFGVLEESNIVLDAVRELRRKREEVTPLPENRKPTGAQVTMHGVSETETLERRGINPKNPEASEMLRLRDALKPLLHQNNKQIDLKEAELHWPLIHECESALERYARDQPEMAAELWGHLVSACENIARCVAWPKTSERWETVRRILLKASNDLVPPRDDDKLDEKDDWPSWGWPSPRLDAACGLPFLAWRLGTADADVADALRRLCRDKSHPLRFNLADRLAVLQPVAPELMWELIDTFIANEKRFSVFDMLLGMMRRLPPIEGGKVMDRLRLIADRAMQNAPADNHIHETLAHAYPFNFLRTGDPEDEAFVIKLIAECDTPRASHSLQMQLHGCRAGGWLTAGDGVNPDKQSDAVRGRTWGFFSKLLTAAQEKLKIHHEALRQLREHGQSDEESVKPLREKFESATKLVDAVAMQLYFASGALEKKTDNNVQSLTPVQLQRFWRESAPLFSALASQLHPHTAYHIVQALQHLLPCAPRDIFLLATKSIRSSSAVGFQNESLAVGEVVKLIQRVLADHRDIFRTDGGRESDCLAALLEVLDLFVEAGWAEARQLTHRLEEIYR